MFYIKRFSFSTKLPSLYSLHMLETIATLEGGVYIVLSEYFATLSLRGDKLLVLDS